jgi:hypothetical protein
LGRYQRGYRGLYAPEGAKKRQYRPDVGWSMPNLRQGVGQRQSSDALGPAVFWSNPCWSHYMLTHVLGVVLGVSAFGCAFAGHLVYSHAVSVKRKERALLAFIVAGGILYTLLFALIGDGSARVPRLVQYVTGAAAFGFLGLGYVEFWSLIERSFSARILIDCASAGDTGLSREDIANAYGGGLGVDWMFQKRKDGLLGSGMIIPQGDSYRLSGRGRLIAQLLRGLRVFLRLD